MIYTTGEVPEIGSSVYVLYNVFENQMCIYCSGKGKVPTDAGEKKCLNCHDRGYKDTRVEKWVVNPLISISSYIINKKGVHTNIGDGLVPLCEVFLTYEDVLVEVEKRNKELGGYK